MDLKVAGNQLILSGLVSGDELGKVEKILGDHRAIDTVILRNSPGVDAPTGYRVGEMFRARGLRTAISGYYYSSCSRMFLGGVSRHFTDDFPPEYPMLASMGITTRRDAWWPRTCRSWGSRIGSSNIPTARLTRRWSKRWINIPLGTGMIHFYHPDLLKRNGVSTFSQGSELMARSVLGCEPIRKTAIELGIAISVEIVTCSDQSEVRALLPERPKASSLAAIEDIDKVPLTSDAGRQDRTATPRCRRQILIRPSKRQSCKC